MLFRSGLPVRPHPPTVVLDHPEQPRDLARRRCSNRQDIAIFSEGKNYWTTFEPIVSALISRGQPFSYFTADIEDPGLTIRSSLMRGRYLGEGSAAYARLNRIRCRVMLATTPNIGTPGFPLPRPAGVEFLVHVFHAPAGVAYYKKARKHHLQTRMRFFNV